MWWSKDEHGELLEQHGWWHNKYLLQSSLLNIGAVSQAVPTVSKRGDRTGSSGIVGLYPNFYKAYSWTTGFAWTLHVVINIQDVLNNMDKDEYDAHFAFQQCLEYAGTTMLVNMPADVIQQVMVYGNKYGANICPQRQLDWKSYQGIINTGRIHG